MTQSADLPVLEIVANAIEPPPAWAVIEPQLMATMEDTALFAADRYGRPDGTPHNVQDVDNAYEAHSYRGMLYSLGAGDDMLDLANRQWNATRTDRWD